MWNGLESLPEIPLRAELCVDRLHEMERELRDESRVPELYVEYFLAQAQKLLRVYEYAESVADGSLFHGSEGKLLERFDLLYAEQLPETYASSFSNPKYLAERYGKRYGRLFSYLSQRLNSLIFYAAEQKLEAITLVAELFIELYNHFEDFHEGTFRECKGAIYSFESDNAEFFLSDRQRALFDPDASFVRDIVLGATGEDLSYLYRYGEYVTENERQVAAFLWRQDEAVIQAAAENVVNGYLRGFETMRVKLTKGQTVSLRFAIGFERILKEVIRRLEGRGLFVTSARTPVSKRHARKTGYTVCNVNIQYDFDHRNDEGFLADKRWYMRNEEVLRRVYEDNKELIHRYAGPLVQETFGERQPLPKQEKAAIVMDKRQLELQMAHLGNARELLEQYVPSSQTSFTIVAYPVWSIGEHFEEIFAETLRLNCLDNETYQRVQQCLVDALDQAVAVKVTGKGDNQTDMTVALWRLDDPAHETIFENCTADVNIPVGEVFTSPVLRGTNGVLHVSSVFLGNSEYRDLRITFQDGKTVDYSCKNYEKEEENKSFLKETLFKNREWLPLGEFAIGTNTLAYRMGKRYGITSVLPILIAEKTGPHFAIGDTCYSYMEDMRLYNPDGKEIVAKENELSVLRKESPEKAYFQCHTDITLPYEELSCITALCEDGREIPIIRGGLFVLPGTELLNEPLKEQ